MSQGQQGTACPCPLSSSQDLHPVPALGLQKWFQVLGHTGQAWQRQGEGWYRVDPWGLRAFSDHLHDVSCFSGRNALVAARPHTRGFSALVTVALFKEQEKVPGRPLTGLGDTGKGAVNRSLQDYTRNRGA